MNPDELPEEMLSSMAEQFGHRGGVEQTRQLFRHFTDFRHSYDDVNFTPPYLGKISAPTLIIHGDRDDFFPVEIPVEMYRSIPDSYLWIVANTGHLNVFEAPGFFETIDLFLDGHWGSDP